jgi:hypothetical protein
LQALYGLPLSSYDVISSGNNGYVANLGYNLVTGLGSPVADVLVPDLVAYHGPGTAYFGPTVGPLQDATLSDPGTGGGGPIDVFSGFDALAATAGVSTSPQVANRTVLWNVASVIPARRPSNLPVVIRPAGAVLVAEAIMSLAPDTAAHPAIRRTAAPPLRQSHRLRPRPDLPRHRRSWSMPLSKVSAP